MISMKTFGKPSEYEFKRINFCLDDETEEIIQFEKEHEGFEVLSFTDDYVYLRRRKRNR